MTWRVLLLLFAQDYGIFKWVTVESENLNIWHNLISQSTRMKKWVSYELISTENWLS